MSTKQMLSETLDQVAEPIERGIEPARKAIKQADEQVRSMVESFPVAAAASALLIGFLLGRAIARR